MFEQGQTPYTPAISLYYGLQAALHMMEEEGFTQVQARHRLMGQLCRAGVKAAGLTLFCKDERFASDTVTAIHVPAGVDAATFRKVANKTFSVILAGGQGNLKNLIFRIGHMGYTNPNDVIGALVAMENSLAYIGYEVEPGRAVAAAQRVWLEYEKRD
jgi:aspartate aminotransferase-like enzyme